MGTRSANREIWNEKHSWPLDGDEWTDQAAHCGQPYEAWKAGLVDAFVRPHCEDSTRALEIGPGHGRWSVELAPLVADLVLADLSPNCIEYCRNRLAAHTHVSYVVLDGRTLTGIPDGSVDFIWSYDTFVHIDPEDVRSYVGEMARVLRPDGVAVIHHSGHSPSSLALKVRVLPRLGRAGRWLSDRLFRRAVEGWRSDLSPRDVARWARTAGLEVESCTSRWGPRGEFDCELFRDRITTLRRPRSG